MQSDVDLNSRLNVSGNVIHIRCLKQGILTSLLCAETWHKGAPFSDIFNVFHHYEPFALR